MNEWLNTPITVTYGEIIGYIISTLFWVFVISFVGSFVYYARRVYREHKAAGTWPSFRDALGEARRRRGDR